MEFTLATFSKQVGEYLIPVLAMEFDGSSKAVGIVESFTPDRLMLARSTKEEHPNHYGITDGNHLFSTVEFQDNWINDAGRMGFFVALVAVNTPGDGKLGRILVVQFPFGHILTNSSAMDISHLDLKMALSTPVKGDKLNSKYTNLIQKTATLVEGINFLGN